MSSSGRKPACCEQLLQNESPVMTAAVRVLVTCADNILKNPSEAKFRKLRIANSKVQECLLPAYGAIECLFEMGFVEADDHFVLPDTAPLSRVQFVHDALLALNRESSEKSTASTVQVQDHSRHPENQTALAEQLLAAFWQQKETQFYGILTRGLAHVATYMNPDLLEKARRCIPLQELMDKAKECCSRMNGGDRFLQDQLLMQLLRWFKESFFQWMDIPSCGVCGGSTKLAGMVSPLPEESANLASRVENYQCESGCTQCTRFPRYNYPGRLLETRTGRCGEWANCFTLMCIAAGLEARHVVDWGDHVWTEVYSTAQGRWLHADPCENVCDEPLLYEAGWGKKVSYVVAYSPEDIQDVTWRYTAHPTDVLARRTECRETWLASIIVQLRRRIQERLLRGNTMTSTRYAMLQERTVMELVELMTEKKSGATNLPGRTTGSEEWRRARGELGATHATKSCAVVPTEREVESGVVELKYTCAKDEYVRVSDNSSIISGWQSLVYEAVSVFRKEERDWKMVYLARLEGSDVGKVGWQFELGSSGACIDQVEILVESECFESGHVQWTLSGADSTVNISPGCRQVFESFSGATSLRLSAELSGGNGRMAWQHAQLFRQKLADLHEYPLTIILRLRRSVRD